MPKISRSRRSDVDLGIVQTQQGTLLTLKAAASRAGLKPRELFALHVRGEGPPFFRIRGRLLHRAAELDLWIAHKRCAS